MVIPSKNSKYAFQVKIKHILRTFKNHEWFFDIPFVLFLFSLSLKIKHYQFSMPKNSRYTKKSLLKDLFAIENKKNN